MYLGIMTRCGVFGYSLQNGIQSVICLVLLASTLACTKAGSGKHRLCDGQRVLKLIERQVAMGPRVPETASHAACRELITHTLDSLGFKTRVHSFEHYDSLEQRTLQLHNIVGESAHDTAGAAVILLCAHYDSRPRCDMDPDSTRQLDSLPGANDGASAVALLLELAGIFAETPPKIPVTFVFLDGEDWGQEGDIAQYCIGSKEFARQANPMKYRFAIVIDIFAHSNATFRREGYSDRYARIVNDKIWGAAKRQGASRFIDSLSIPVYDDQVPLLMAGIPSTDIIDMSYKQWHTTQDLPHFCDPEVMAEVGNVLADAIYAEGAE